MHAHAKHYHRRTSLLTPPTTGPLGAVLLLPLFLFFIYGRPIGQVPCVQLPLVNNVCWPTLRNKVLLTVDKHGSVFLQLQDALQQALLLETVAKQHGVTLTQ